MNETIRKLKDVPYNLNDILEELRNSSGNSSDSKLNVFKQTVNSSELINNNDLFEITINHNMDSEITSVMVKTIDTKETIDFSCIEIDSNNIKIIISEAISIEVLLLGKNVNISSTGNINSESVKFVHEDFEATNVREALIENRTHIKQTKDGFAYNVKTFGAKGDGITNDDVAIQEADSKDGILFFPKGRYILTSPPNSKSYGVGAVLVVNGNYEMELDSKPLEVNSIWQTYIRLNNTDLGINAGKKLTPESYGNVSIGNNAMKESTNEVIKNIAIGHNALTEATELYQNIVIGTDACSNTILSERNTIIGGNAGISMGDTIVVGRNHMFNDKIDTTYLDELWADWREYAGEKNSPNILATKREETTGNTAIGRNSLGWSIKPKFCTAIGYNSLEKALEGHGTVALGVNSAYNSIKSVSSVIAGLYANMNNSTNEGDVSIGASSMSDVPHSKWNVAIGYQALQGKEINKSVTISDNVAIGRFSQANTQGETNSNVAIGSSSLRYNQGSFNTAIGQQASQDNTIGSHNTAVGFNAGKQLTRATHYTALGFNALNNTDMDNFTNITGVGQNSTVTGSNQLQLGNSLVNPYAFNPLQLRSDMRDKLDIEDIELGLDFIMKLRPVQYRTNFRESYIDYDEEGRPIEVENDGSRAGKRKHLGLIAQEVKHIMDEIGVDFAVYQDHSINGGKDVLSLGYEELISPLIKAIQELNKKVIELENRLNS